MGVKGEVGVGMVGAGIGVRVGVGVVVVGVGVLQGEVLSVRVVVSVSMKLTAIVVDLVSVVVAGLYSGVERREEERGHALSSQMTMAL